MTRKAGFCPTCGAPKCHQRWNTHAMTDFSHELVDDARLSHLNPADVFKCPSCGFVGCVVEYHQDGGGSGIWIYRAIANRDSARIAARRWLAMRISDEERRRVAQNLRNSRYLLKPVPSGKQVMSMTRAASELELAHEGNYLNQSGFERLAALIDRPTTTLTEDEDGRTCCANCGCVALYISEAAYCPDCGAEVVG